MKNLKQVILIGKADRLVEEFIDRLSHLAQVQLCPVNEQILEDLLSKSVPELFFLLLPSGEHNLNQIFAILSTLASSYPEIPLIIIGKLKDEDALASAGYLWRENVHFLSQPVDMHKIEQYLQTTQAMASAGKKKKRKTGKQYTVMLVDDSPQLIYTMRSILCKKYEVTFTTSGLKVISTIEKKRPDIILLDYEMPLFNGRQTLEMLRSNDSTSDIPVIFLTGMAEKKNVMEVIALKPHGYILKSALTEERLFTMIEEILENQHT